MIRMIFSIIHRISTYRAQCDKGLVKLHELHNNKPAWCYGDQQIG